MSNKTLRFRAREKLSKGFAHRFRPRARSRLEGKDSGIPHLAKSERDAGHPAVVPGMELDLLQK
jgi:hypothetical protein